MLCYLTRFAHFDDSLIRISEIVNELALFILSVSYLAISAHVETEKAWRQSVGHVYIFFVSSVFVFNVVVIICYLVKRIREKIERMKYSEPRKP